MKQTKKSIEKRDKLARYISFHRLFGRQDPERKRKYISTNLSAKVSGILTNGKRNADLNLSQKNEVRDKLTGLKRDIDDYLNEIEG